MNEINQIYEVQYMKDKFSYVGTLRNEKIFNINDKVFFSINGNEIAFGRIVGVELTIDDNPEYIYKIELPKKLVDAEILNKENYEELGLNRLTLKCDRIFYTIMEAKESAFKNLDRMYELQEKEIQKYFNQFKETNILHKK